AGTGRTRRFEPPHQRTTRAATRSSWSAPPGTLRLRIRGLSPSVPSSATRSCSHGTDKATLRTAADRRAWTRPWTPIWSTAHRRRTARTADAIRLRLWALGSWVLAPRDPGRLYGSATPQECGKVRDGADDGGRSRGSELAGVLGTREDTDGGAR